MIVLPLLQLLLLLPRQLLLLLLLHHQCCLHEEAAIASPMLIVACLLMTEGDRGVSSSTTSVFKSCTHNHAEQCGSLRRYENMMYVLYCAAAVCHSGSGDTIHCCCTEQHMMQETVAMTGWGRGACRCLPAL